MGVIRRVQMHPFLTTDLPVIVSETCRHPFAFDGQPIQDLTGALGLVKIQISLAQIFERAAVVRIKGERLVIEDEGLIEVAKLSMGESHEAVSVIQPGLLLNGLGHMVDHALPILLVESALAFDVVIIRWKRVQVVVVGPDGKCRARRIHYSDEDRRDPNAPLSTAVHDLPPMPASSP